MPAPRVFYGWTVVAGAFVILFTAYGARYGFGVLLARCLLRDHLDPVRAIVGDFFGYAHAGSLVGFPFMLAGSMAAWGPLPAGAIHVATASYGPASGWRPRATSWPSSCVAVCRPPRLRYTPRP